MKKIHAFALTAALAFTAVCASARTLHTATPTKAISNVGSDPTEPPVCPPSSPYCVPSQQ